MTFEEMFKEAQALLNAASAKGAQTHLAVQFDVSGDGCGAFYAEVSADSDDLTIAPYDYKGHDVLVSADAAELLDALRSAETAALTMDGEWDKVAAFREILATLPKPKKAAAPKAKAPAKKAAAKAAPKKAETPKATTAAAKKAEPVKTAPKKAAAPKAETKPAAAVTAEAPKAEAPKAEAPKAEPVKAAAKTEPVTTAKTAATAAKPAAAAPKSTANRSKRGRRK